MALEDRHADMPTTGGSLTLAGSTPPNDAFIARRMRDGGAIVLGELTLTEFAYAFEQATRHRVPPASTPPLPSDFVRRP